MPVAAPSSLSPRRLRVERRGMLAALPGLVMVCAFGARFQGLQLALALALGGLMAFGVIGGRVMWGRATRLELAGDALTLWTWGGSRTVARAGTGRAVRVNTRNDRWLVWLDGAGRSTFIAKDSNWPLDQVDALRATLGITLETRTQPEMTPKQVRADYPSAGPGPELPTVVKTVTIVVGVALAMLIATVTGAKQ